MARPSVVVSIAFASAPSSGSPTWTAVTSYALRWSFTRGRQHELDRVQAGTGTLTLSNTDRRFEPLFAGGAYSPNVIPLKRVRIQAVWASVTYDLFHGYVERWTPRYPTDAPQDALVEADLTDGFGLLGLAQVTGSFPQQLSGARIGAVLDAVGWPAGERTIAAGLHEVRALDLAGTSALPHLQAVAEAENGYLYMGKDGKVVFEDRASRVQLPITNNVTLGDGGGSEELYVDAVFDYDSALLYNEIRGSRAGGAEQVVSDGTSIAAYLTRTLTLSDTENAEDGDVAATIAGRLAAYKQPQLRARSIELDAEADQAVLWPQLLGREVGDRLTVRKRPPGGGAMIDQPSNLEGVSMAFEAAGGAWRVSWQVTPADTTQYWQIGDATYGVLDSTTRLWY